MSCAYSVHQYHVSDFSPYNRDKGKRVVATAERFVILQFSGDTTYIDKAYQRLIAQCKKGRIVGIATQLSTVLGFFSHTDKVRMEGRCIY